LSLEVTPEELQLVMRDKIALFGETPFFEQPLDIVRPTFPPQKNFLPAFQAALAAGQVTNNGAWVLKFERQLSAYLGVPTLVFCNGQTALMTMIQAAGIDVGIGANHLKLNHSLWAVR
jgi:hypothetical protein